ncbi:hypothetical protein HYQ46_002281 [Verticillium longisporum]|nr:hypothetical protein HYQ46_002281 [Verticillium longisporum]
MPAFLTGQRTRPACRQGLPPLTAFLAPYNGWGSEAHVLHERGLVMGQALSWGWSWVTKRMPHGMALI